MASRTPPVMAASLRPAPARTATPMPSRPIMNSQSAQGPEMFWKNPPKGPSAWDMNPWAGVPPLIQAFAEGVA